MKPKIPRKLTDRVTRQAGIVTRQQAIEAGVLERAADWLTESGWWEPVYPGVYATFTGPLPRMARLWAAVLYAGPGARLSHETAAELFGLSAGQSPQIHVTISAARKVRAPAGVVIHRSRHLSRPWQPVGFPPHTFIEETIIDLVQGAANADDVIALVTQAFNQRLTHEAHLRNEAARRKKLRWRRELNEVITAADGGAHSVLEYRYDRDVERAHGLPAAGKQVPFTKPDGTKGFRDRYYDKYRLVVELDGKQVHDQTRDQDRRRDNQAVATTGATLRYTWNDVTRTPCDTAAQLHQVLRARGYRGPIEPCSPRCTAVPASSAAQISRTVPADRTVPVG